MHDLDPSGKKFTKDDMHHRVSMLENLGILESSSEDAAAKHQSNHGIQVLPASKDSVYQEQQKQLLEPIQACTQDANVDQIMLDKRILHLLEMTNEVMHDAENPPHAVLGRMNPPRPRQISEPPDHPSMQLQPGAYRQRGLESEGDDTSESFDEESAPCPPGVDLAADANHDHHDLVSAEPVTLPTHSAEPVDADDREPPKPDHSSLHLLLLLGACLLLMGIVFLVIFLQDSYQASDSSSPSVNDSSLTSSPWSWDLPFTVTNLTVHIIELDTNRTTPQARAYDWMKNDPHLATYSEERLLQRFVMVVFYYATSGEEWTYQGGGTVTVDISLLQQRPSTFTSGSPTQGGTNGQGNLTDKLPSTASPSGPFSLHPSGKVNLTSEPWLDYTSSECEWISSSPARRNAHICSDMDELLYFGLERNNLEGRLPLELVHLTGIKALELSYNKIGGQVISELGTMSSLQELLLLRNRLTGTLPSELGQLKLLSFEILSNLLTGTVPLSLWKMSTLKGFRIGENALSGSLPTDIGMGLPEMKDLAIPRNQFNGSLPVSLGLMTNLENLVFAGNDFSRSVPSELGNLSKLHTLVLELNQLSGVLPSELGLLTNLSVMKLEGNAMLGGTLPTELATLNGTLRMLTFKDTSITGTIPAGLCGIEDLSFDCSTSLCGCSCPCS